MTLTELVIAALAVWESIEVWRHGSLFASRRASVELREDFIGGVLRCGFCLAPWVSWLACYVIQFERHLPPQYGWLFALPVNALAVARLANLGNDMTAAWCRTPKSEGLDSKNVFGGTDGPGRGTTTTPGEGTPGDV